MGRAAAFAPALTLAGRERMPTPRCCAWRRRRCSRALARPTPPTPPSPRRACGPCRHPTPTPHGTEAAAAVPALRWPRGRCCRFDDALAAERVRNLSAPRRRRRRAHARTQGSARPSRAVLPSSVRGRESYTSWLAGWLALARRRTVSSPSSASPTDTSSWAAGPPSVRAVAAAAACAAPTALIAASRRASLRSSSRCVVRSLPVPATGSARSAE
eukprot:SAG25_NODE_349_length_9336_cov_415.534806_4_plen_215_part_00